MSILSYFRTRPKTSADEAKERLQILYWMHLSRRDAVRQVVRGRTTVEEAMRISNQFED